MREGTKGKKLNIRIACYNSAIFRSKNEFMTQSDIVKVHVLFLHCNIDSHLHTMSWFVLGWKLTYIVICYIYIAILNVIHDMRSHNRRKPILYFAFIRNVWGLWISIGGSKVGLLWASVSRVFWRKIFPSTAAST